MISVMEHSEQILNTRKSKWLDQYFNCTTMSPGLFYLNSKQCVNCSINCLNELHLSMLTSNYDFILSIQSYACTASHCLVTNAANPTRTGRVVKLYRNYRLLVEY